MSRPSLLWTLFWIVLVALCATVWHVAHDSGRPAASAQGQNQDDAEGNRAAPLEGHPTEPEPAAPDGDAVEGLLATLPVPQSPPARLSAGAKQQWLDDLMTLIDDASYLEDEASLRMLIVEFRNPEPGIAAAARASLLARADKKALPYLLEMRDLNLSKDKQRQLEEMIEFLSKRSVFEHMKAKDL